ncbi:Os09g0108450 [Oryza sativa Japonica Group]|uniref:Os09g0108450 protein n=1 Tax=Oryza sativa subsp. japonica TaxID=39947 RepID=A0A0P0XJJ8_ORYSJ|nr:Os09g0108450 [Oryza sativa Japonica Group]
MPCLATNPWQNFPFPLINFPRIFYVVSRIVFNDTTCQDIVHTRPIIFLHNLCVLVVQVFKLNKFKYLNLIIPCVTCQSIDSFFVILSLVFFICIAGIVVLKIGNLKMFKITPKMK